MNPCPTAVTGDDGATARQQAISVLGHLTLVDTGRGKPVPGSGKESKAAAHAQADHAHIVGAVGPGREPGPGRIDVLEGPAATTA